MSLESIALIGARSRIGPAILTSLSRASPPSFTITILLRPSSKPISSYPHTRTHILPSDTPTLDDLTAALTGHDALICALHPSTVDLQLRLADACHAAQVRRYILADYGSVESDDPVAEALVPLFRNKTRVRQYCQQLAREPQGSRPFTWTSLVTGHFFDYGLGASELLGFNLRAGTVRMFDGGAAKWSTSTLAQIGRAVVGVLRHAEDGKTAGKVLYVHSFSVSQKEVLDAVEAVWRGGAGAGAGAAGGEEPRLKITEVNSDQYVEEMRSEMESGSYDALEQIVCVLGLTRARWEGKKDFANELLGLREEDLGTVVVEICTCFRSGVE